MRIVLKVSGLHRVLTSCAIIGSLSVSYVANAVDFLDKRECTIGTPSRAPVHTRCIVSGGMQNGRIDVSIKTPDGKRFALEGPIDGDSGADGTMYLLQNQPARIADGVTDYNCYRRTDAKLEICLGKVVD